MQQLGNRIFDARTISTDKALEEDNLFTLGRPDSDGPLHPFCCLPAYSMNKCGSFSITLQERDNCCMQDDHIIVVKNIAHKRFTEDICLIGFEFLVKEDLYTEPFQSSRLNIYVVSGLSELKLWPLQNLRKMVKLPWGDKFVVLGELHTF